MYTTLRKAGKPVAKFEHWLVDYFKKNPIKSISASLTFIGLISIYAYHFHIEYSPAFDLKSLASVIFSSAYVGLSLFVACSLVIFMPAIFIGTYFIPAGAKDKKSIVRSIAQFFVIAGFGFYGMSLFILVSVMFDLPIYGLFALLAEVMLIYLGLKRVFSKTTWPWTRSFQAPWYKQNSATLSMAWIMAVVCLFQIFPLQVYWIFMRNAAALDDENVNWSALGQQLMMVNVIVQGIGAYVVAAWRVPGIRRAHKLYAVVACLCAPIPITFFGGNTPFLATSLANILKIGNFATKEITLTPAGCDVVADRNGSPCEKDPAKKNKIYGAYVMSRIGTETYLKIARPDSEKSAGGAYFRDILVPSKDIMGMEIDYSKRYYNKQAIEKSFQPKG